MSQVDQVCGKIVVDLKDAPAFIYGLTVAGATFQAEQKGGSLIILITGF